MARFAITKKQLTTDQGQSLLRLLMDITSDGELTEPEVRRVEAWVRDNGTELPAASYLLEVLQTILSDGRVSLADRWDLLLAIEKVVPTEERVLVKMRRRGTPEPVTPRQLEYLRILHVPHDDDLTKEEAAALIDHHKERHSRKRATKDKPLGCGAWIFLAFLAFVLIGYCSQR